MARAVNVGIVAGVSLILHVGGVDGDAALTLLRSLINGAVVGIVRLALHGEVLGDGGGEGGLAVVNVANGANVDMGLASLKFLLSHFGKSSYQIKNLFPSFWC